MKIIWETGICKILNSPKTVFEYERNVKPKKFTYLNTGLVLSIWNSIYSVKGPIHNISHFTLTVDFLANQDFHVVQVYNNIR